LYCFAVSGEGKKFDNIAVSIPLNTAESLLNSEIAWLKKVRENSRKSAGDFSVDENMLEGHLTLCRELLAFMPADKKYEIGSSNKAAINLVKDLIEDFIFPASRYGCFPYVCLSVCLSVC
jgi:ubiquitin carboxyl-terminal hydrolase 9/24